MPSPSAQCFPHTATHTYTTWGNDADGGRIPVSQITRHDYDCCVQPDGVKTQVQDALESGLRRETHFTPYVILYPESPKLNIEDIVTWIEPYSSDLVPTVHTIIVTGTRSAVGLGSVWEVTGEERQ